MTHTNSSGDARRIEEVPLSGALSHPISRRQLIGLGAAFFISAAAAAVLPGCSGGGAAPLGKAKDLLDAANAGSSEAFLFTDTVGRQVALPTGISKIVPSGAYAQVLLVTLCPEKLIALSSGLSAAQSRFFPECVVDLPKFGKYYGTNAEMNYEAVISAAPDAIVDVGMTSAGIDEDMDSLQHQTGIPAIHINAELRNIAKAYEMLGEALEVPDRAQQLSKYADEVIGFADAHHDEVQQRDIKVMYSTGAYGYQVKEKGSIHSQVLDVIGLNNVAVTVDANTNEVSPEQVMIWQPDHLVLSPEFGFIDSIYDDPTWSSINAVKNHQVYEVPWQPYEWLDRPPSIQLLIGMQWLGNLLCPDIYDFDIIDRTREFFDLFWGYNMTREEAAALIDGEFNG